MPPPSDDDATERRGKIRRHNGLVAVRTRRDHADPGSALALLEGEIIARRLGVPDHLDTFQATRPILRTDMQQHGTLKDTQGTLRRGSTKATGDVYVKSIEGSGLAAANARTAAALNDWEMPDAEIGLKEETSKVRMRFEANWRRQVAMES